MSSITFQIDEDDQFLIGHTGDLERNPDQSISGTILAINTPWRKLLEACAVGKAHACFEADYFRLTHLSNKGHFTLMPEGSRHSTRSRLMTKDTGLEPKSVPFVSAKRTGPEMLFPV